MILSKETRQSEVKWSEIVDTGLYSQKSKGMGEVIFGDSCWEGVGFRYVRIIYVIMVQL